MFPNCLNFYCFEILIPQNSKCPEGTKPMLIFAGDMFDVNEEYRRLKSLLIGQYIDYLNSRIAWICSSMICWEKLVCQCMLSYVQQRRKTRMSTCRFHVT